MNCPVCQRSLAPTLSICPSCGAMMNDTVREEVEKNITAGPTVMPHSREIRQQAIAPPVRHVAVSPRTVTRVHTNGLVPPKTSPTLVEFSHKNKAIPEWRLQLQNAVQQRRGGQCDSGEVQPLAAAGPPRERKAESVVRESSESISDPRVASAMRRITESRNTFLESPPPPKRPAITRHDQPRPFGVVAAAPGGAAVIERMATIPAPRPKLVNVAAPPVLKRDTNKLPRIEIGSPVVGAGVDNERVSEPLIAKAPIEEVPESKRIQITVDTSTVDEPDSQMEEADDIEDLAPFSMRFGAGLFDFIIGTFASMLILSPLVFAGMEWMSLGGMLTLAGTVTIMLFLYMTACLGFFGKTAGMKLFSLELVDAVENEYPTLRQSAVNSSVFLLSIGCAGIGFVTMLFNEEKRALHDLLSGTILVREF